MKQDVLSINLLFPVLNERLRLETDRTFYGLFKRKCNDTIPVDNSG